ncbi:AsmA family protein [Rhizobium sp. 18065]|uniref:AsmA family protein n=1 Tax=Rhizobium sp. 18065 TaxID=2681411 RepID=UPI00135AC1D9|nr:AsmA family protein [Rhizobium sp. 18065]
MLGRILVSLGGLLVVALFSALLAPLFVDWTNFRQNFEDRASHLLGKKVVVHGSVNARILPFPSVTMEDVTIGTDLDGTPLVQIARFSLDAELAPLLSGEARIFDMRIEEPKARIRLLPDGTLDWLRGSKPDIPARTVVLENVSVIGAEVEFIDQQSGRNRLLRDLDAEISARSLSGPWTVEGRAVLDGEPAQFSLATSPPQDATLPLRLKLDPETRPFDLVLEGALAFEAGRPVYKGRFESNWKVAENASEPGQVKPLPGPRVKGDFELTNERVAVPGYRLELGDPADPYVVNGEAKLDTGRRPEFLLTADGQQVDVNRLAGDGTKAKTSRSVATSVRQRLALLLATAAEIPIPSVPGRASLKLPAIVAGDTVFRDIQLDVRPAGNGWTVDRAVAVLPGRTQVEAKGWLRLTGAPSFDGELLVASTQPSGLATWISGNVDPAIRQLKSAGFSASVNLTSDLQRFENLELAVGAEPLKGRVERESVTGSAASLSVDLTGDALDLDAARAIAVLLVGEDAEQHLLAERIAARLKVGTLSAYGIESHDVDTVFSFDSGKIAVERLNVGDVSGASIEAHGAIGGSLLKPSGQGRIVVSADDPGPFLELLHERLPGNPLLPRLAASGQWYADSKLTVDVSLGNQDGGGLAAKLSGTSNGSRIEAQYKTSDLINPTDATKAEISATLENEEAQILLGQAGLEPLPLAIGEGGLLGVTVTSTPSAAADAVVTYTASSTSFQAHGTLATANSADMLDGDWTLDFKSDDLGPYLLTLGSILPETGTGLPVTLDAKVGLAKRQIAVQKFSADVDGNAVSATGTIDWQGEYPKARGSVSMDRADLEWLAQTVLGPVRDPASGALVDAALPKTVAQAEFAVELSAKRFTPGFAGAITDFAGKLSRKAGEIVIDDVSGQWLGGRASGRLSLANSEGAGFLQARLDLTGVDLAQTLSTLRAERGIEDAGVADGVFDATFVAEGSGNSVGELFRQSSGSGEIKLVKLNVPGFKLDIMADLLREADVVGTAVNEEKVREIADRLIKSGPMQVTGLSLPFAVTDGVVRVQNATVQTPEAQLGGDLRLSLTDGAFEAGVQVSLDAGEAALPGTDAGYRMLLSGDALSPTRSLDVTGLTNFLSLRAFEIERRRVETLQSNVLEKQRLRREAALARFRQDERDRAEVERLRLEQEARLKAEADEAERLAQEQRSLSLPADPVGTRPVEPGLLPLTTETVPPKPSLPVAPEEKVTRQPLPPVPLTFDTLPGLN